MTPQRQSIYGPAAVKRVWCIILLAGLGLGCELSTPRSSASLDYSEDAHASYKQALESFNEKNWEDARALFSELRRLYSYSRYAKLAALRLADIDFEQGKYAEAIGAYRTFIRGHRSDPNVEYAKYRICKALFLDVADTVLLPPAEERDQGNTEDAHRELRGFARRFPGSRYRKDAQYMLNVVTHRLVRHELYVARYYLQRSNFRAAVLRIDYALKTYPRSGMDPEALVLKGETLLKWHKPRQARKVLNRVIKAYGGPFATVAKRFLDAHSQAQARGSAKPADKDSSSGSKALSPTLGAAPGKLTRPPSGS